MDYDKEYIIIQEIGLTNIVIIIEKMTKREMVERGKKLHLWWHGRWHKSKISSEYSMILKNMTREQKGNG